MREQQASVATMAGTAERDSIHVSSDRGIDQRSSEKYFGGMFMKLVVFLRKVRVVVTPRSWLLRTRLENGALIAGYNRAGWGGRGVYIFRDALEPELASLSCFVKPGSVFVDIGANVGAFTLKAAKEIGDSGVVIAIEPFIETARQLSQNIKMNRYRNCRVRMFCAGRKTGQTKFWLNKDRPTGFSLIQDSDAESISVLSVSLNDLCDWEGITRLDYLKIDVEGAEDMILEGGESAIARFRPIIQVEVTKTRSNLPPGYSRFSVPRSKSKPNSMNNVFIPLERVDALEAARTLGWTESSES
jgi:FkbM family methyltransferase